MRMHKKKNLASRMLRTAAVLVSDPASIKGRWLEVNKGYKKLFIELGCGKGTFYHNDREKPSGCAVLQPSKESRMRW